MNMTWSRTWEQARTCLGAGGGGGYTHYPPTPAGQGASSGLLGLTGTLQEKGLGKDREKERRADQNVCVTYWAGLWKEMKEAATESQPLRNEHSSAQVPTDIHLMHSLGAASIDPCSWEHYKCQGVFKECGGLSWWAAQRRAGEEKGRNSPNVWS